MTVQRKRNISRIIRENAHLVEEYTIRRPNIEHLCRIEEEPVSLKIYKDVYPDKGVGLAYYYIYSKDESKMNIPDYTYGFAIGASDEDIIAGINKEVAKYGINITSAKEKKGTRQVYIFNRGTTLGELTSVLQPAAESAK